MFRFSRHRHTPSEIAEVIDLLEEHLAPVDKILLKERVRHLANGFFSFVGTSGESRQFFERGRLAPKLVEFILDRIRLRLGRIAELKDLLSEYHMRFSRAFSERERRAHVIQLARRLGATPGQIRGDRKAFGRWFGHDTVIERVGKRISQCEYELTFLLNIMGGLTAMALFESEDGASQERLWKGLNVEKALKPLLVFRGDPRVRIEAFRVLAGSVAALLPDLQANALDASTVNMIYRSALDTSQHAWIQSEALKLLSVLDTPSFVKVLSLRLKRPLEGDDIFFRRRAVTLLGQYLSVNDELVGLIPVIMNDPSPFVRQGLAVAVESALSRPSRMYSTEQVFSWAKMLVLEDSSVQVRAATIARLSPALIDSHLAATCLLLREVFSREQDPLVIRTCLRAVSTTAERLSQENFQDKCNLLYGVLIPSIESLHERCSNLSVRRWAAMSLERLAISCDSDAIALRKRLLPVVRGLKPGKSTRISKSVLQGVTEETLGRVLAVMTQEDFGLSVQVGLFGLRITRGDVFGFRWWRFFHELFLSAPDKRQGFGHTVARKTPGTVRAPSAICSELSQTKVPGEPLYMASESSWRPYLPLVDDALTCANRWFSRKPFKFYTAEGTTELRPPRWLPGRMWASIVLTVRFARYARLRNWSEDAASQPDAYVRALERLGFRVRMRSHGHGSTPDTLDPAVARFFGAAFPLFDSEAWRRFSEYFFSAYENSLYQLGVFAAALLAFFVGQRTYLGWAVRKARKSFQLVIGGWGTRGKSGVERLKTALFEALGHGLVAKTTGCEAMFLHAYPFGKTREMFIYRSYDKATIWEHHTIMVMGRQLRSDVFLWECMGLNPSFVKILQRQWAIDDYSTITNTYPDHEDIQGPAGVNIPQVMCNFIPKNRVLVTSEQEMRPVLEAGAQALDTKLVPVGWIEPGLLTPDLLARFPYQEHPNNIALVLRLAKELGIDEDFAAKEIADRVVPDIGVLKVFPTATIRGRRLEFVNGMSANERFATLSNWTRMGFDAVHPETHPGIMISTVVNNRADRISRSRVFASILVEDIAADRHFLIGSNVLGLMGFIGQAWDDAAREMTLSPKGNSEGAQPETVLAETARRLRIPTSGEQIRQRLQAMLEGVEETVDRSDLADLWDDLPALKKGLEERGLAGFSEEITQHMEALRAGLRDYEEFSERVRSAIEPSLPMLDRDFKKLAREWFMSRFVVMEDYHASGDQVIDRICRETPPGMLNRIMGIQNIKGTGLDFVYKWLAWQQCHAACQRIVSGNKLDIVESGVSELSAFQDYGLLCEDEVTRTLADAQNNPMLHTERFQAELALIESRMGQRLSEIKATLGASHGKTWWRGLVDSLEAFLDAGDAVRRRKRANRIYKDLVAERISHDRAAMELKALNKRQSGGWLAAWLGKGGFRDGPPSP
ncbi:MAG: hypothetical protein AB1646_20145 [Thermodesulfobacteriota bacterium]